ncbi:unnamed protein product [Rhodiola kirilowii]
MRTPLMIMKQEFIKKWTAALDTCCRDSNNICALEKHKVIKQTASIAMAAAKQGSTAWSRAILADGYDKKTHIKTVLMGSQIPSMFNKHLCTMSSFRILGIKHKAIRRRRRRSKRTTRRSMNQNVHKASSSLAKSIVKKQTQVLKTLIPGGRAMEECCLIEEALDYIVSLKTQVDVMKELVNAAEYIKKA